MKKLIALGLISFSLSASLAEAKFFLGIEGGYEMSRSLPIVSNQGNSYVWGNQGLEGANYQGWTVGINLGTEHLFGDFFGFRWFFGVNYGDLFIPSYFNSRTIAFRLGIDAIINFVSTGYVSFGMIIGLETGLTSLTTLVAGQVPVAGRIGLTTGLGEHNRIDLIVGIPFYTLNTNTLVNDPDLLLKNVYNPLQFTLGYKFLF